MLEAKRDVKIKKCKMERRKVVEDEKEHSEKARKSDRGKEQYTDSEMEKGTETFRQRQTSK